VASCRDATASSAASTTGPVPCTYLSMRAPRGASSKSPPSYGTLPVRKPLASPKYGRIDTFSAQTERHEVGLDLATQQIVFRLLRDERGLA